MSDFRDTYAISRPTVDDVSKTKELTKVLLKSNGVYRINNSLNNILNVKPDYGINSLKNKAGSWVDLLMNIDTKTLYKIRKWLRDFTVEVANSGNFKEVHFKGDTDLMVANFKSASIKLHEEGYLRVSPKVRFKAHRPIIMGARLTPLLRDVGASYNIANKAIELNYPYYRVDEELIFHELCHAYLQSFVEGSFFNKFPSIVEGTTELMTLRLLSISRNETLKKSIPRTHTYFARTEIVKLLCNRSKGKIIEEDFVWATYDRRWLKKLQTKLNNCYGNVLGTKDVLKYIEKELKYKKHNIFNDDFSNLSLKVLADLKVKLKAL